MIATHTYRALLIDSGFGRLFLAYGLARIPVGINALAMALVVQAVTASAASAGLATACYLFALGAQSPLLGRLIDRRGPGGLMMPLVVMHVMSLAAFVATALSHAPLGWMLASCVAAGLSMPPVSAVFRAVLRKSTLPDDQRHAAFALDAVLVELCFIGGPLLTALCAAFGQAWMSLIASALMVWVGSAMFVRAGGVRAWGEPDASATRSWAGPLRVGAVRTIIAAMALIGVGIGLLEMGLTAAAIEFGKAHSVGWAFAALSVTSAVAGLVHGSRTWAWSQGQQFAASTAWLALGSVALAGAPSVWVLVLVCLPVGFAFAPAFTTGHTAMSHAAPAAQSTEAFTWMGTVLMVGIGAGWALSGQLVDGASWRAALACGAACMLAAGALGLRFPPPRDRPAH